MWQELKEKDIFLDRELRKRDQFFDEVIIQRDLECRRELEQRETEWREVRRVKDVVFWEETSIHVSNLLKILKDRDKSLKAALESRDKEWLNSLQHCKDSLRLNTQEMINNITLMETLRKRQCEFTEGNAKILN